ncbi:hypothetical protein TNCV_2676851 [Trichonephila clavipes]|nr:hypothetical protein TNCV_2676851 [Trichonephila clavipes]
MKELSLESRITTFSIINLDVLLASADMCSCNCRSSSNSPIGKVELLNQSGPLNPKLHLSSLDGGIPLVPQSGGFSRPLTKFQCTLGSALEFVPLD